MIQNDTKNIVYETAAAPVLIFGNVFDNLKKFENQLLELQVFTLQQN